MDPNLKVDLKGLRNERVTKTTRTLTKPMSTIRDRMITKPLANQNGQSFNSQQQQQQIASSSTGTSSTSGGLKPLMSSSSDSMPSIQTIQQLMSQPIQRSMPGQFNPYGAGHNQQHRQHESFDDKHIVAKHNSIYPTQDEITAIQDIVTSTEKALKLVSDQIAQE